MKYAQHVSSCTSLALAEYVDYSSTHTNWPSSITFLALVVHKTKSNRRNTHIPLLCTAGTSATDTKDGFENRNWNRDVIHLRYEMQHPHNEWDELFLSQKPFAVRLRLA